MDVMDMRRRLMMMAGGVPAWKYTKYTYQITQEESYDTYADFDVVYVAPLVGSATTYMVIIKILNNGSVTRSALWHIDYVSESVKVVTCGKRVGGNFENVYGGDLHVGATVEIYISTDVPAVSA